MRHTFFLGSMTLLLSLAAAGCGGGSNTAGSGGSGGAGGTGAAPAGGGGAAPAGGGGAGGSGGAGAGGSGGGQIPPTPVDCKHVGSGRDIQVGNPAPESGPGIVQVSTIGEVDWNNLEAGDTVRIFWREQPYHEKILLRGKGTPEQPIRVCGVPGPGGALPRISGDGASTRPDLAYGDISNTIQDLGVLTIWNRSYEERAEYIHVEGLSIADTLAAPGSSDDVMSYTATDGSTRTYRAAAACIRVQEGRGIVLRGNELSNCGNGLFIVSRVPESQMTREVLIEGNYLHGNGVTDEEGIHSAYIQGVDFTLQFNYFGATRPGAAGNNVKMRVAGDVIRYNYFERGARVLDLVEVEDHAQLVLPWQYEELKATNPGEITPGDDERVAAAWQAYQQTHVYGNVFFNAGEGAATNLVHYSFDNVQSDRRPGTLYFFDNTIVVQSDFEDRAIVRLLDQGPWWGNADGVDSPVLDNTYDGYATMEAWNNVIYLDSATPGATPSYFELTRYRADKLNLGKNWIVSGWDAAVPGYDQAFPGFGNRLVDDPDHVYPGGNDTHHVTGAENLITGAGAPIDLASFRPLAGGPLLGEGAPIPASLAPHTPAYELDPATREIVERASVETLGARETP